MDVFVSHSSQGQPVRYAKSFTVVLCQHLDEARERFEPNNGCCRSVFVSCHMALEIILVFFPLLLF